MTQTTHFRLSLLECLGIAGILTASGAVFYPVVVQARSPKSTTFATLHRIGTALAMYAQDYDGESPSDHRRLKLASAALSLSNPGDCSVNDANWQTTAVGCTDMRTGLTWSQGAHDATGTATYWNWQPAVDYCRNLNQNGYTGWRLPTLKEMETAASHDITAYLSASNWGILRWSSTTRGKDSAYGNDFLGTTFLAKKTLGNMDINCVRP